MKKEGVKNTKVAAILEASLSPLGTTTNSLMSMVEFSRHLGVNRSTVTRWHQQGRVLLNQNKKVLVTESLARLEATEGHRIDLKQKHALKRGTGIKTTQANQETPETPETESDEPEIEFEGESTTEYQAIRYAAENDLTELNRQLENGNRLHADEFHQTLATFGKQVKEGMERVTDNLAPQIKLETDPQKRKDLFQNMLSELGKQLKLETHLKN